VTGSYGDGRAVIQLNSFPDTAQVFKAVGLSGSEGCPIRGLSFVQCVVTLADCFAGFWTSCGMRVGCTSSWNILMWISVSTLIPGVTPQPLTMSKSEPLKPFLFPTTMGGKMYHSLLPGGLACVKRFPRAPDNVKVRTSEAFLFSDDYGGKMYHSLLPGGVSLCQKVSPGT
jgi:hypothetical protein